MKPPPCFEPPRALEAAARRAERRKHQAIERLKEKLTTPNDPTRWAMIDLIDTDKSAHSHASEPLREKGRS